VLGNGSSVDLKAGANGARAILLAGKPLGEPVVQYGPFVMNTREEIETALQDYRRGTLTG
jgi:redox-sensitive bicupin YhaK (pirin superfamily)